MADVFISYSRTDKARVQLIINALASHGINVWSDHGIEQNAQFQSVIRDALNTAHVVLVCWSEASANSRWVQGEADYGDHAEKYVGCLIGPCRPPPPFNVLNNANLVDWSGDADDLQFLMMLIEVGRKLGRPDLVATYETRRRQLQDTDERRRAEQQAVELRVERERSGGCTMPTGARAGAIAGGRCWRCR